MIEKGQIIANKLWDIASREEAPVRTVQDAHFQADRIIRITTGSSVPVAIPVDSEELRYRITLLGSGWE